jgi:hypothetical protein
MKKQEFKQFERMENSDWGCNDYNNNGWREKSYTKNATNNDYYGVQINRASRQELIENRLNLMQSVKAEIFKEGISQPHGRGFGGNKGKKKVPVLSENPEDGNW